MSMIPYHGVIHIWQTSAQNDAGWWLLEHDFYFYMVLHILGMSLSQPTNSYVSEGFGSTTNQDGHLSQASKEPGGRTLTRSFANLTIDVGGTAIYSKNKYISSSLVAVTLR